MRLNEVGCTPYVRPMLFLIVEIVVDLVNILFNKLRPFNLAWPGRVSAGLVMETSTTASGLGTAKSSLYSCQQVFTQSKNILTDCVSELRNYHSGHIILDFGSLPLVGFDYSAMVVIPFKIVALQDNLMFVSYLGETSANSVNNILYKDGPI